MTFAMIVGWFMHGGTFATLFKIILAWAAVGILTWLVLWIIGGIIYVVRAMPRSGWLVVGGIAIAALMGWVWI